MFSVHRSRIGVVHSGLKMTRTRVVVDLVAATVAILFPILTEGVKYKFENYAGTDANTEMACVMDSKKDGVMFKHTAGASVDMNPEECWMNCYEMYAAPLILIGLSETNEGKVVCFCSPQPNDFPTNTSELGIGVKQSDGTRIHFPTCEPCLGHGFQNYLGPGVGAQGLNCGRDGAVAVLKPVSKAKVIKSLSVVIHESTNEVLQADLPTYDGFRTFKAMNLSLVFNSGVTDLEFICNSASYEYCDSSASNAPAPPLDITIDYGDNSGVARWNEDAPADIFQHVYSAPGTYHITIQTVNTMDLSVNVLTVATVIKGPVLNNITGNDDYHEIELTCPLQVVPGSQFTCSIDVPRGSGMTVLLEMTDDIDTGMTPVTTPEMHIPDAWWDIPGGPLATSTYNGGTHSLTRNGLVFPTNLKMSANISHIEVIPGTEGSFLLDVVEPVCPGLSQWCPLTSACEAECAAAPRSGAASQCEAAEEKEFCSLEGTCNKGTGHLICPSSFSAQGTETRPVNFARVAGHDPILVEVPVSAIGTKFIFPVPKRRALDEARGEQRKTHEETTLSGDYFLAIRCGAADGCIDLYFRGKGVQSFREAHGIHMIRSTAKEKVADLETKFAGDTYTASGSPLRDGAGSAIQVAVRALLYEDRFLQFEQALFCDKTTEKTVTVTVKDEVQSNISAIATKRLSCMYPLMEIKDVSADAIRYRQNLDIPLKIIKNMTTGEELQSGGGRSVYNMEVWLRNEQPFTFGVDIVSGSHLEVNWTSGGNSCLTKTDAPNIPINYGLADTNADAAGISCQFPFRLGGEIYYGCTGDHLMHQPLCATVVDDDYKSTKLGWCDEYCHRQAKRSATGPGKGIFKGMDGSKEISLTYELPVQTELYLPDQRFTIPGKNYSVELSLVNRLTPNDSALVTWTVINGQPIKQAQWDIEYSPVIYSGNPFTFKLIFTGGSGGLEYMPTMPRLRVLHVPGRREVNNHLEIGNEHVKFYDNDDLPSGTNPPKSEEDPLCVEEKVFYEMGVESLSDYTQSGTRIITIGIPAFSVPGRTYGFAVEFTNPFSSIKYDIDAGNFSYDTIRLLDPMPAGSGEWLELPVVKWDANFVQVVEPLETPVEAFFRYTVPDKYGDIETDCEFQEDKDGGPGRFYLPTSGWPMFGIKPLKGTVTRVKYDMVNRNEPSRPPCILDFPKRQSDNSYKVGHCPILEEGTYDTTVSGWNELDDWVYSDQVIIEVLAMAGPIEIDDFAIIRDANEPKEFEVRLENAGKRTCVTIDWADGLPMEFYGNLASCRRDYPALAAKDVLPLNLTEKVIRSVRTYAARGMYNVNATAFDMRHRSEASLPVTIFKMSCQAPRIWIPLNFTDLEKPDLIPTRMRSAGFEIQSVPSLNCKEPVITYMTWRLYNLSIEPNLEAATGSVEKLTLAVRLNETLDTWNMTTLSVPARFLEYGLYKAVFKLEIETFIEEIELSSEAFTYFRVVPSPIIPSMIEGSATKTARGWAQMVELNPRELSVDPDSPEDKDFDFKWFCRRVHPIPENYSSYDENGWPEPRGDTPQPIRPPGEAVPINTPPGCFGHGPGPLKTSAGKLHFNTSSFISYAQAYEFALIVSSTKDSRRAMVTLEVDVGSIPAPIVQAACLNEERDCFPMAGGVMINPTSRLALVGSCVDECVGELSYLWTVLPSAPDHRLEYMECPKDLVMTTVLPPSTTAGTTTTTTEAPLIEEIETQVLTIGTKSYVASMAMPSPNNIISNILEDAMLMPSPLENARRKREVESESDDVQDDISSYPITKVPNGCHSTFGDGLSDARSGEGLAIRKDFFRVNADDKKFQVMLNVTKTLMSGDRNITSSGITFLNLIVNQGPEGGTCRWLKRANVSGVSEWHQGAEDGYALVDQYRIACTNWIDPEGHAIIKYVFKYLHHEVGKWSILYSGPRDNFQVVLPAGTFDVTAEIHDDRGAFTKAPVVSNFRSFLPSEKMYEAFDMNGAIEHADTIGDAATKSQLMAADSSIRSDACYMKPECKLKLTPPILVSNMTAEEKEAYVEAVMALANANKDALSSMNNGLPTNSMDSLEQAASTLSDITASSAGDGEKAKTMDSETRKLAVEIIQKLSVGFNKVMTGPEPVSDPDALVPFIEGTTGSVFNIIESLNQILRAGSLDDLPPTDVAAAETFEYDTDIDSDIPDNKEEAYEQNILKITREKAVDQINEMTALIDDIGRTVVANQIVGESVYSNARGVRIIMTRLNYAKTIGKDVNADGRPDIPLRFDVEDSSSAVQFPLGFCPGDKSDKNSPQINFKCIGEWGFVIKEWETIVKGYVPSANNLNPVTTQLDIDVYNEKDEKVHITNMKKPIELVLKRNKWKNESAIEVQEEDKIEIHPAAQILKLRKKNKRPIIYHQVNVTIDTGALTIQIKLSSDMANSTKIVMMASYEKVPIPKRCDTVVAARSVSYSSDYLDYLEWFIPKEMVANRRGRWFVGVMAFKSEQDLANIKANRSCEENGLNDDMLDSDFGTRTYKLHAFISGCYFLNQRDSWVSDGMSIDSVTEKNSGCTTSHLTSFATGFFPMANSLDFKFVFAAASFQDNLTINLLLIFTIVTYLAVMIWAIVRDKKDERLIRSPAMRDNHPEDNYFYELIVETGPMANHGTTSKVEFILKGSDESTEVRTLNDPGRKLFGAGARDAFLMSTQFPLGELVSLRIWQDSTGLADAGSWYLLSVSVLDLQTGEKTRFIADQWLALDRHPFEDDVVVHAIPEETIKTDADFTAYYLMKSNGTTKIKNDHVWFSVFSRPVRSRHTRKQRVSLCMAYVCLSFLAGAMLYKEGSERIADGLFSFGMLTFDPLDISSGLTTAFIVFPPIYIAKWLFQNGARLKKRRSRFDASLDDARDEGLFRQKESEGRRAEYDPRVLRRRRALPAALALLGWAVVAVCILGGLFMVFAFALTFGNDVTYQFIVAEIFSLFTSILVVYPIYILLATLFLSSCCKSSRLPDEDADQDEEPPVIYWDGDRPPARREKARAEPDRRHFSKAFREQLRQRRTQEVEMNLVLKELALYSVYLVIIFLISYGTRDPNAYLQKEALEKAVIYGSLNCEILPDDHPSYQSCNPDDIPEPAIDFTKVRDVNEWWYWFDRTLMPNVRVQPWYNEAQPYGLKGYLNDRVNRLIGYAIVRQVREGLGSCRTPRVVRSSIAECTGKGGIDVEDSLDYCANWEKIPVGLANDPGCLRMPEYEYTEAKVLEASPHDTGIRVYGGGGYVLRLTGFIDNLEKKVQLLKETNWIDNRTRGVFVEFNTYNAQVNHFSIVRIEANFIGGGIRPTFRIDPIKLFSDQKGMGNLVLIAEVAFAISTFYYMTSVVFNMKREGCRAYCSDAYNFIDVSTVIFSLIAIALKGIRVVVVRDLTKRISETKGNEYIRLQDAELLNRWFNYFVAINLFTSTLKMCRLLSFHKAFKQIGATIKLCFQGLSTFFIEFLIVFMGFTCFFYFLLKNELDTFRDIIRAAQNTIAMSIGKFNFGDIKDADLLAAWIFFGFSIVVNMILINMMIAIINIAFDDIKTRKGEYESKFALISYIKRAMRHKLGTDLHEPVVPRYADDEDGDGEIDDEEPHVSQGFSEKTDLFLKYVEDMYMKGTFDKDDQVNAAFAKMGKTDKKTSEMAFDTLFGSGKSESEED